MPKLKPQPDFVLEQQMCGDGHRQTSLVGERPHKRSYRLLHTGYMVSAATAQYRFAGRGPA